MVNPLSGFLQRGYNIISGFCRKSLLPDVKRAPKSLKLFSVSNVNSSRYGGLANQKKQLPNLFYVQNPITWLINKIDFIMLRSAWDPEFSEQDFKRGVKQAVAVICTLISNNLWKDLRGLVTSKTLTRLQREVEVNLKKEQRKSIAIEPSDIKLILPRKVHFLRIADQKFVDVDVICVAMKFREEQNSLKDADIILIEVLSRFHRNYTIGQLPNWTVTVFKVTSQNIRSGSSRKVKKSSYSQEEEIADYFKKSMKNIPLIFKYISDLF